MSSILKFRPISTTYVDSGHANQNFYENRNIFAGSIHETSCSSVMFKSLITFDLSQLKPAPLTCAYLCLYVKDTNSDTSYYSNNIFSLYENTSSFDVKTVTWNTIPETDYPIHFTINEIGRYIKINITHIVNNWMQSDKNYGITIEANNFYSSLVKFASMNSSNPPWLLIENKSSKLTSYDKNEHLINHSFR